MFYAISRTRHFMKQLLLVLLAFMLLPSAIAGTAEAPEVTDPRGDNSGALLSGDILSMWIDDEPVVGSEENPQLFLHIDVGAAVTHVTALYAQHSQFRVDMIGPDGQARYLSIRLGSEGPEPTVPAGTDKTVTCQGEESDGESYAPVQRLFAGQLESDTRYGCIFPANFFGPYGAGATVTGMKVGFYQTTRGPLASDDQVPATELIAYDETAVGADYLLPFEAEPIIPEYNETIEGLNFTLNQSLTGNSAIYNYEWASTNATIHEINGKLNLQNGTTSIRVTDPDGTVHFDESYSAPGTFEVSAIAFGASAGTWNVSIVHDEVDGALSLLVAPDIPAGSAPEGEQTEGEEKGEPDKESPGIGLLAVLGFLGLVSVSRRK